MNGYEFLSVIDEKKDWLDAISDDIRATPELAFREYRSSSRLCKVLRYAKARGRSHMAAVSV